MIGDVRLVEETVGVAGDIYVLDGAVLGASLLGKVSPSTIKKFMICVQVRLIYLEQLIENYLKKIRISTMQKVLRTLINGKELKEIRKILKLEF